MSTANFASYREYVPAGASWLGSIPKGWRVLRGKYAFREYSERSETGSETLLSVSEYFGVKPRGDVVDAGEHLSRAESLVGYKKCAVNDLAMNIMLAWKKGLGVSKYDGIVSPAYSVFRFMKHACPDYMHYLLRTDLYADYFKARSTGIMDSRLRLYPDVFGDVALLLPPEGEQAQIAKFLDYETAKIDALIEKQQQLIALLKEKRQAVISHAVTKGLNPDAPMRDSGVEWLGEVPAHWATTALKRLVDDRRPITYGIVQPGEPDPIGKYMIRGGDYSDGWCEPEDVFRVSDAIEIPYRRSRMRAGDLIITIVGAGVGNVAVVPDWLDSANITQTSARIALDAKKADAQYVCLALQGLVGQRNLEQNVYGAAQPRLNIAHIDTYVMMVPPLEEQRDIAEFINLKIDRFGELEAKADQVIQLLQERRTALISAAVTGKIDVRGWKAPETAAEAEGA